MVSMSAFLEPFRNARSEIRIYGGHPKTDPALNAVEKLDVKVRSAVAEHAVEVPPEIMEDLKILVECIQVPDLRRSVLYHIGKFVGISK